jgi:prepilin-type N-terminal cleavage/methylation domain-containing protein
MFKNLKKQSEGFTIIEVMIVLVIAAVILLIVFLAVPALQRNSRNNQRKNDVAAILAGVSEFENNNNGSYPTGTWTNSGGNLVLTGSSTTSPSTVKVGYYNQGITAQTGAVVSTSTVATLPNNADHDYVTVTKAADCNGDTIVTGSSRSVAAQYVIETGPNQYQTKCQST